MGAAPQVTALVLNADWAPALDKTSAPQRVVVQTVWSPRGVLHYGRCLLACLTNMGQLTLYGADRCNWVEQVDVSRVWLKYCRKKWSRPNKATNVKHQITELQYRAARIKYTAVAWERFHGDDYSCSSLLFTASQDGVIGLWIVEDENYKSDMTLEPITIGLANNVKVKLVKVFDSKLTNITSFLWCSINRSSGVLVAGNVKGAIHSMCINFSYAPKLNDKSGSGVSDQNNDLEPSKCDLVCSEMQQNSPELILGGFVGDNQSNLTSEVQSNLKNVECDQNKVSTADGSEKKDLGVQQNDLELNSEGFVCGNQPKLTSPTESHTATSEAQPNLASETQPNLSSETQPNQIPESLPNPIPEPQPNLTSESQPNPTSEYQPNLTSEPQPNLISEPQPNLTSEPQPNLTSEPQPNLTSEQNSRPNPVLFGDVDVSVEALWPEEDLLTVSSLICWDADNDNVCAVCIKGMHIIVLILRKDNGKLVSKHCHNTRRTNLTGLIKLNNAAFLIGSQRGAIFKLTLVQDDSGEVTFLNETVQTNFIKNRYGVMGLAASRNRAFIAVNVSLNGPYDHSKLKTLSSFVIGSFEGTEIDPMAMMNSKNFVNLDHIWDCLENARLNILQKSIIYLVPPTIREQLDTMDINPLIVTMWLTNFVAYSLQLEQMEFAMDAGAENKYQTMMQLHDEIRQLVFASHVLQRCTNLLYSSPVTSSPAPMTSPAASVTPAEANLASPFHLHSLRLMRHWLMTSSLDVLHSTTRLTASSIVEQIDEAAVRMSQDLVLPVQEECVVCGADVPSLTDFSVSKCTAGHLVPRCSLSLVQIPTNCVYLYCSRCGVLAHPQAVIGNFATCVFCNDQLIVDENQMTDEEIDRLTVENPNRRQEQRARRTKLKEDRDYLESVLEEEEEELRRKRKKPKKAKKS